MPESINLFSTEVRRDPYPTYATLREAPVQKVAPMGAWAVSRREDVVFVLRNQELFSSKGMQRLLGPDWLPDSPIARSLLVKEGPEHTRLRALIGKVFTPSAVVRLEPRVRQIAHETAEAMAADAEADFISRFAAPFPAKVIAEVLGLDPSLVDRFGTWADHMASISPIEPPSEHARAVQQTISEMDGYFREVIGARRAEPKADFATRLVEAEVEGQRLSDDDIVSFMSLLLPAGFETTRHFLANSMLVLLDRPQLCARLRREPAQIPTFLEEVLRFDAPVHSIARIATQDVELGGALIPRGSMVLLLLGATGREPGQVERPERFEVGREERAASLAFGHGAHFCIGAPLARLEAKVGIEVLLSRFRGFEPGEGEVTWNVSPSVRGPVSLPIRLLG